MKYEHISYIICVYMYTYEIRALKGNQRVKGKST